MLYVDMEVNGVPLKVGKLPLHALKLYSEFCNSFSCLVLDAIILVYGFVVHTLLF